MKNELDVVAQEKVWPVNGKEKNVIAYLSGVLAWSFFKKSSCKDSKNLLVGPKLLNAYRLLISKSIKNHLMIWIVLQIHILIMWCNWVECFIVI